MKENKQDLRTKLIVIELILEPANKGKRERN